jgi:hypothetical protein
MTIIQPERQLAKSYLGIVCADYVRLVSAAILARSAMPKAMTGAANAVFRA